MVNYIGPRDPTARRLLEAILAKEAEHAEDLSSMLRAVTPAVRAAHPGREK
jgi:bacterioferritin